MRSGEDKPSALRDIHEHGGAFTPVLLLLGTSEAVTGRLGAAIGREGHFPGMPRTLQSTWAPLEPARIPPQEPRL